MPIAQHPPAKIYFWISSTCDTQVLSVSNTCKYDRVKAYLGTGFGWWWQIYGVHYKEDNPWHTSESWSCDQDKCKSGVSGRISDTLFYMLVRRISQETTIIRLPLRRFDRTKIFFHEAGRHVNSIQWQQTLAASRGHAWVIPKQNDMLFMRLSKNSTELEAYTNDSCVLKLYEVSVRVQWLWFGIIWDGHSCDYSTSSDPFMWSIQKLI